MREVPYKTASVSAGSAHDASGDESGANGDPWTASILRISMIMRWRRRVRHERGYPEWWSDSEPFEVKMMIQLLTLLVVGAVVGVTAERLAERAMPF